MINEGIIFFAICGVLALVALAFKAGEGAGWREAMEAKKKTEEHKG